MTKASKAALIIGHPGHELRVFKYIKEYTPDVFILTDGSGSNRSSRIHQSIQLLISLGAKVQCPFPVFTDKDFYNIILMQEIDRIISVKKALKEWDYC